MFDIVPGLRHTQQRKKVMECETGSVAAEPESRRSCERVGNDKRRQRDFASNDLRRSMALRYGSIVEAWPRATRLHDTASPAAPRSTSASSMFLSGIPERDHPEVRQLPQVRWSPIGWCAFRRNMPTSADLVEVTTQSGR